MFKITTDDTNGTDPEISQSLDDLAREGARRMIADALELEVEEYLSRVQHLRDEQGHAAAVRNGKGYCQMLWIRKHGRRMPVRRSRPARHPWCNLQASSHLETSRVRRPGTFHQL